MLNPDQIPVGLDAIIALYGSLSDPNFESQHIILFDLPYPLMYGNIPITRARCHKLAVDNFVEAFKAVQAAGLAGDFTEFNGIYARRSIRGQPAHPSAHSWGIAIDMGASTHLLGNRTATWPSGILDAFSAVGFEWGGNFKSRRDSMHWQLCRKY